MFLSKAINFSRAAWSASVANSKKASASSSLPTISINLAFWAAFHCASLFSWPIDFTCDGLPTPETDPISLDN